MEGGRQLWSRPWAAKSQLVVIVVREAAPLHIRTLAFLDNSDTREGILIGLPFREQQTSKLSDFPVRFFGMSGR